MGVVLILANSRFFTVVLRGLLEVVRTASHSANKWHVPCLLRCRWRGPSGDMTGVRSLVRRLFGGRGWAAATFHSNWGHHRQVPVVLYASLIPKLGPLLWAAFETTRCSSSCCPCVSDLCAKSLRPVTAQWAGQPRYNSWRQVGQFGSINNATGLLLVFLSSFRHLPAWYLS